MNILELDNVTKAFGGMVAVNNVSMHIKKGEIVGLIGPNGAGKTTLLNAIAGLNPPTSGKIRFLGRDVTNFTPEKMCHRGLSRTFQIPVPFPQMSALDTVVTSAIFGNKKIKSIAKSETIAQKLLEFVEFPLDFGVISENLNTVELKRLDLARALASDPELLFLDELAAGLTGSELDDIISLITKIRDRGVTILMVEHIMKLIMSVCDRLMCICFGSKIADGEKEAVANDPKVLKAYLGTE